MSSTSTSANTTPEFSKAAASVSTIAALGASLKKQGIRAAKWDNVAYSASVLGTVNVIFLLMWLLDLPALALVFYCLATTVVLGLPLTRFFSQATQAGSAGEVIQKEPFMELCRQIYEFLNSFAFFARRIFYWIEKPLSMLVVGILFVSGYVFSYVTLSTLLWLALNVALIWVPTLELYKKHVAKFVEPYAKEVSKHMEIVLSRIPKLNETIVEAKTKKI